MLPAMIPYIHIPSLDLKYLVIDPFGVCVAAGILVGFFSMKRRAGKLGLDPEEAHTMAIWMLLAAFTLAHVVSMVFYFPERLREKPWEILFIWAPISSLGGFAGAFIGSWLYARRKKLDYLAYADAIVWGLIPGWVLGRLGCSLAHDHPGAHSDFFLAVKFPGGARHDLGFYEFLFTLLVLLPLTRWLGRKRLPSGGLLAIVPLAYAPVRFGLDFLRSRDFGNVDPRYAGLTAAQWLCLALLLVSGWLLWRLLRRRDVATPANPPA